jgi:Na+-translocating ferredoxin:NAD+ oxidoreductase subunit B
MDIIVISVIILCVCGLVAGVTLAVASRVFSVQTDPRVDKIEKLLPGANCSGCGNPSCYAYAKSMVEKDVEPNLCVLAQDKGDEIGGILGKEISERQSCIAAIKCCGGVQSEKQYKYSGISSCRALMMLSGGDSCCQYGCLGFGDCIEVCQFNALSQDKRGEPVVDRLRCTGCGKCVDECPKNVILLLPETAVPFVACNSRDKGKIVRHICHSGCIGCRKCIKSCSESAISLQNEIIQIDYDKCNGCGKCIEECPRDVIKALQNANIMEVESQ